LASQQLTTEQAYLLAFEAWRWLTTSLALYRPRDTSRDVAEQGLLQVDFQDLALHETSIHLLVLGLHHVNRSLHWLDTSSPRGFPVKEADSFRSAWKPLRDLRDLLEHLEDYLIDRGRKPELKGNPVGWVLGPENVRIPVFSVVRLYDAEGRVAAVSPLGETFDLSPAVQAATALLPALTSFLFPAAESTSSAPVRTLDGWGYIFNERETFVVLPNGDRVEPGDLYSEGTQVLDPLPDGLSLFERPDRWDPSVERWNPAQRRFEPT
jgi:hypothetical protein